MKKIQISIKILSSMCAGLISLGMASTASAALLGRLPATPGGTNYQAYYDNVANLTWLADANYAKTSGYAATNANVTNANWLAGSTTTANTIIAEGWMGWAAANTWAANLMVDGVSGWRLPTTLQPDASCSDQSGGVSSDVNCTGSEMGNLYYNVLGGVANSDLTTTHNANYNLFSNVVDSSIGAGVFWSATEYAPGATNTAWVFLMDVPDGGSGIQLSVDNSNPLGAWAVHSGDVSAVPVPAAVWLLGSGLLGLIGVARRKHVNV